MSNRRDFMRNTAIGLGFASLFTRPAAGWGFFSKTVTDDVLDLEDGFRCKVISRSGSTMTDGYRTPALPDGMGCFVGDNGRYILMRNHEVDLQDAASGPYQSGQRPPAQAYDRQGMGGVTRMVVNAETLQVESDNLVLVGTARNCGGGMSPWGWLSCEETMSDNHGYVFLCDSRQAGVSNAQRITAYGRFNHEAAAVDPRTNICYLTEDRTDGCFYRFVPDRSDDPFSGKLQALRIKGRDRLNTGRDQLAGQEWACEWVDIRDPDPHTDTVRSQGLALGAAMFVRGEGLWIEDEYVYFGCTSGGPAGAGQIFRLTTGKQSLKLLAQSGSRQQLDMPDNITVRDGRVYMAEDGNADQYIRVLKSDGSIVDLARNKFSRSEFAGLCFSPDGKVLFANIQKDGLTIAITGPFAAI
jgi:hypothetical protein